MVWNCCRGPCGGCDIRVAWNGIEFEVVRRIVCIIARVAVDDLGCGSVY